MVFGGASDFSSGDGFFSLKSMVEEKHDEINSGECSPREYPSVEIAKERLGNTIDYCIRIGLRS
jgi:hypothetical protein